jgi:hypothetical protein
MALAGSGAAAGAGVEPVAAGLLELAALLDFALLDVAGLDEPAEPQPARVSAAITAANERNLPHDMLSMMPCRVLGIGLERARKSVKILCRLASSIARRPAAQLR